LVLVGINNVTDLGIKKPKEHKRIVAMPHLSPGRLEYLLMKARGLLYPSFNEGFGYPPLEAMSVGVPCVVSECTSIPEVCGDAAIYCDPTSIQSIAASINRLLQNEPDVHKLKHQAAVVKSRQNKDLNVLASLILGASDQFNQVRADKSGSSSNNNHGEMSLLLMMLGDFLI
jgi:glycosyltransferase involved in cell wall biosynthesis